MIALLYLLYTKKVNIKMVIAEIVPILFLGIPLFIEQLVISRVIEPFSLGFMDFYPTKRFRGGEISFAYVGRNIIQAPYILFVRDGMGYINSPKSVFGTIFYLSIPFMIGGLIIAIVQFIKSIKSREYNIFSLVFIFYVVAQVVALMTESLRVVSANELYFPLMLFTALGIISFMKAVNKKSISVLIVCLYGVYFLIFAKWAYSGSGWSYETRPQTKEYIFVDIHAARAAGEIKKKHGDKPIQMIINEAGDRWYESICLFTGTSPLDFNQEGYSENGYDIGIPEELDLSGNTVYLIEDNLHHITDYLVSEGFAMEPAQYGEYTMVYK